MKTIAELEKQAGIKYSEAIKIINEASYGIVTIDDKFHRACKLGWMCMIEVNKETRDAPDNR